MTDSATPAACGHIDQLRPIELAGSACEDCLAGGTSWVHLRQCLTCGRTGCCDESPMKHARRHQRAEGHVLIRSAEPDEDWSWCYVDRVYLPTE